jgi:hypothetical protein
MQDALTLYALQQFHRCVASQEWQEAIEWLERVPAQQRPKVELARAHEALMREELALGRWGIFEKHLQAARALRPSSLLDARLPLAREHAPLLDDHTYSLLRSKVDPAKKLPPNRFAPAVTGVYTCGAYNAWTNRGLPWSRFLRIAKSAPPDTADGAAALRLAGEFLCRVVFEETPLLKSVDVVVSVPANPARYVRRMMSLPDQLARALEGHFALPFLFNALVSDASDDLELRGLNWRERHQAIVGSMRADKLGVGVGRTVLVVDDITTSGATLNEAARMLRAAGAADVYAVTLSHTEG